jgi:periplasmic mercuric ion binding protein
MKTLIKSIFILLTLGFCIKAQAGKKSKITKSEIMVYGVCGDCQERIQEAVYTVNGVKSADWNKKTKLLKVAYAADKCSILNIENAVAAIGHDTDNVKASDEVYNKLPGCCAYRSGLSCKH